MAERLLHEPEKPKRPEVDKALREALNGACDWDRAREAHINHLSSPYSRDKLRKTELKLLGEYADEYEQAAKDIRRLIAEEDAHRAAMVAYEGQKAQWDEQQEAECAG